MQERRKLRSTTPNTAASLYMIRLVDRYDVDAIVLADTNGNCLGGAEVDENESERIVSRVGLGYGNKIAKTSFHAWSDSQQGAPGGWKGRNDVPLWAWRFNVGPTVFLLTIVGHEEECVAKVRTDAIEGFSRIYRERAA